MALLAYLVGFAKPGLDFAVHFIAGGDTEGMYVVARGDRCDLPETGIFQSAGQDDVADQVIAPEGYGGKAHAYLEGDAGLFGYHAGRAAAFHQFCEGTVEGDGAWSLAGQMLAQGEARAEVGLVTIGEEPVAFRAFPERWRRHGVWRSLAQLWASTIRSVQMTVRRWEGPAWSAMRGARSFGRRTGGVGGFMPEGLGSVRVCRPAGQTGCRVRR